jgi:hypothetical protein
MAATVYSVARNWFAWANGNPKNTTAIRSAFNDCMSGSLGKGGMDSVTSASKNGISMQKTVGMSESERMDALRIAIQWLDQGFVTSNRSLGRF